MATDDIPQDATPAEDETPSEDAPAPEEPCDPADDAAAQFEADLDVYPLRDPSEDPGWAIKTVWTWVGMCLFCIAFVTWLVIMSFFYD